MTIFGIYVRFLESNKALVGLISGVKGYLKEGRGRLTIILLRAPTTVTAASDAWADCGTAHLEASEILEALATWRDFCRGFGTSLPWEPTFPQLFKGYNPYFLGLKPSFFMVLGSKGSCYSLQDGPLLVIINPYK